MGDGDAALAGPGAATHIRCEPALAPSLARSRAVLCADPASRARQRRAARRPGTGAVAGIGTGEGVGSGRP